MEPSLPSRPISDEQIARWSARISRRDLLRGGATAGLAGLAAGGIGLDAAGAAPARAVGLGPGGTLLAPGSRPYPDKPAGTDTLPQIENIVVLMMENHSFDDHLGMLGRGDGFTLGSDGQPINYNPDPAGGYVTSFHEPNTCGPDHSGVTQSWNASHLSWDNGTNMGFVGACGPLAMGYWDQADLPFYYGLAGVFPIGDRYFCSVMAQTYPNRRFLTAATALGDVSTDASGISHTLPPNGTIFQTLNKYGITWKDYYPDVPTAAIFLPTLIEDGSKCVPINDFFTDAAAGTLPQFSLVDPYTNYSEENNDISIGEAFAARIIDAVLTSPQWSKTALIWTYDEHGGYYDHVPPQPAVRPDDVPPEITVPPDQPGAYDYTGFRVPVAVVSPYAKRDYVSHQVYDHTSILKLVETKWNLPALTYRDANARDMLDFFDFTASTPPFLEPAHPARPAQPLRRTAAPHVERHLRPGLPPGVRAGAGRHPAPGVVEAHDPPGGHRRQAGGPTGGDRQGGGGPEPVDHTTVVVLVVVELHPGGRGRRGRRRGGGRRGDPGHPVASPPPGSRGRRGRCGVGRGRRRGRGRSGGRIGGVVHRRRGRGPTGRLNGTGTRRPAGPGAAAPGGPGGLRGADLPEGLEGPVGVHVHADLALDGRQDAAVGADDEGGPLGGRQRREPPADTELGGHRPVGIGQQREVERVLVGEPLLLLHLVGTDADALGAHLVELGLQVPEVAALGGAPRGHGRRVEEQHHRAVLQEVRQTADRPVLIGELEVRSQVTFVHAERLAVGVPDFHRGQWCVRFSAREPGGAPPAGSGREVPFEDLPAVLEEPADHLDLLLGVRGEESAGVADQPGVQRGDRPVGLGDDLHEDPSPVGLVMAPADEPRSHQAVDGERGRPARQAGGPGQGPGGHGLVLLEDVQAPEVGPVDPEPFGHRLIEGVVGPLVGPQGRGHRRSPPGHVAVGARSDPPGEGSVAP